MAQQLPGYGCVAYKRDNSHAMNERMSQLEHVLSLSVLNVLLCTAHYLTPAHLVSCPPNNHLSPLMIKCILALLTSSPGQLSCLQLTFLT